MIKTQCVGVLDSISSGIQFSLSWRAARARFASTIFALVLSVLLPRVIDAAEILYGDMTGTDVTFLSVREASDDPLPLYGAPNLVSPPSPVFPCVLANNCTVNGNSLTFSPALFDAISTSQVPLSETTDGQLLFTAQAKPGKFLNNVVFQEGGALSVTGLTGTTNDTHVDVSLIGFITVTEIDGVGVNPIPIQVEGIFDFGVGGNGTWRFVSEGVANGKLWNGSDTININQELTSRGISFTGGATKASVNIDNILFAQSELTGSASIDKKRFFIITFNIPEPTGCGLALLAVAGGAVLLRRFRR